MKTLLALLLLIPNLSWGSENEDELSINKYNRLFGNQIETTNLCEWLEKEIKQETEIMNSKLENPKYEINENNISKLSDKITIYDHHECSGSIFLKMLLEDEDN